MHVSVIIVHGKSNDGNLFSDLSPVKDSSAAEAFGARRKTYVVPSEETSSSSANEEAVSEVHDPQ